MKQLKLSINKTIRRWDDALPIGNGDLGCLIWGSSRALRFSIDKSGIWDCSNSPELDKDFNYANLKMLVANKNQRELNRIFDDCYLNPTPTKLPTGRIVVDLKRRSKVNSTLDVFRAEASISTKYVKINSFVNAVDDYGLILVNKVGIEYSVVNPSFGVADENISKKGRRGISQSIKKLCYQKAVHTNKTVGDITFKYFVQPINDGEYGIFTAAIEKDNSTLIAYTAAMLEGNNSEKNILNKLEKVLNSGYDNSLKQHEKWWHDYFSQSAIEIPHKKLEFDWYYNNYLFACCSRKGKYPMPLQGVWTADNDSLPPWKGDYHHDLNTQMSYISYLKANHMTEGEAFIDFLLSLEKRGEEFAEKFYGVKGLCLPSVMDIKGYALGGWGQYSLSPTNQLWLCLIMARHYHFSGDDKLLKEKIFPYLKKVGEFLLNILEEKNGVLKLPLSTSPEYNNNWLSAWLEPNTNYDLALMRAFAQEMIKISSILGKCEQKELWENQLSKMEQLAINKNCVLKISSNISLKYSHRHLSHCMAIYPLKTMKYDEENKGIIDATIANIEKLGGIGWVGYTLGWLANLYVVQGNGEKAQYMLNEFFKHFCTKNGFHSNGDFAGKSKYGMKYRYFTLEGNFLATDAINNMLLYSEEDGIRLFPAIPKEWKNVAFENLRGYGGVLISARLVDGKLDYLKIKSENSKKINILANNSSELKGEYLIEKDKPFEWQNC